MQIHGDKKNQKVLRYNQKTYIPFILEDAGVLAAFTHWSASPAHRIERYAHGDSFSRRLPQSSMILGSTLHH